MRQVKVIRVKRISQDRLQKLISLGFTVILVG